MRTHVISLPVVGLVAVVAFGSLSLRTSPLGAVPVPTVIFEEDFTTLPGISEFTHSGGGSVSVVGGTLHMVKPVSTNPLYVSTPSFVTTDSEFTVETDIGTFGNPGYDPGNVTYGLVIGNRSFGSFIGFGTGLFNVVNLSSGVVFGYDAMSFTSLNDGTLHHLTVDVDMVTNFPDTRFDFTFTDANTLQQYTDFYIDTTFVPGAVGYFSAFSGSSQGSTGVFDNLQVIALREEVIIPEPSTLVLAVLGLAGAAAVRRRRKMASSRCGC
jgi:hypothetical protein